MKNTDKGKIGMSRFDFLKEARYPEDSEKIQKIYGCAKKAEAYVKSDPDGSAVHARRAVEGIINWLYAHDPTYKEPSRDGYQNINIRRTTTSPNFINSAGGSRISNLIKDVMHTGNRGAHFNDNPVLPREARFSAKKLLLIASWFVFQHSIIEKPTVEIDDIDEALIEASKEGNADRVKKLISEGANLDCFNEDGATALMVASENGHIGIVKILVRAGVDVEQCASLSYLKERFPYDFYLSPEEEEEYYRIHEDETVLSGYTDDSFNYEFYHCERPNLTVLMLAIENGHIDIVRFLVKKGAKVNSKGHCISDSPLERAIGCRRKDIAEFLIQEGADVNDTDAKGLTPLIIASYIGHKDIVTLLISKGSDINRATEEGSTALTVATSQRHKGIITLLIEKGADINLFSKDGWTALMSACEEGHEKIASLLIDMGADTNIPNKDGVTALMIACMGGHENIAFLLIEGGADVNIPNKDGVTALMIACMGGHENIASLLIDKGADINRSNNENWTPLMVACMGARLVPLLAKEKYGMRYLTASMGGHEKIVPLLIEEGADVHLADKDNWTALSWAHDPHIIETLVKAGAHAKDSGETHELQRTVIDLVAERKRRQSKDIFEKLLKKDSIFDRVRH